MLSPFFTFMNFYFYYVNNLTFPNFNLVIYTQLFNFLLLFIFFYILIYKKKRISNSIFINFFKIIYTFIYGVVQGSIGNNGIIFFPFLFFFWLFIFFFNLIGLFPFAFTIGSHFSITICFSIIVWLGALILLLESEGIVYFEHFFPKSINFYLGTFISFIELLSFIFRAISLALRLFANLVAGHVLLHLCGALVVSNLLWYNPINFVYIIQAAILLFVFSFLFSFELIVSFVQSYIFLLLTCIYLQDTLNNYSKNTYYFSTKYLRSVFYTLYTQTYYSDRYKSIFFNYYFSPQNIKHRLVTSRNKYSNLTKLYTYFNKEDQINKTLKNPEYKYNASI